MHTPEPQESIAEFFSAGKQRETSTHTEGSDHDTRLVLSQEHTVHSPKNAPLWRLVDAFILGLEGP